MSGDADRAYLDGQYNLRVAVPEHPDFFEHWASDSGAARATLSCQLDLQYGDTEPERLDYFPAADGRRSAPLLAFIHGGYWRALDARDFSYLAVPFVAAGAAYASVNYALAPSVGLPEIVRQCRAAMAWLWRQSDSLGFDRNRMFVAGHSAGGHLTAMTMLTDWPGMGSELPQGLAKGGCAVSGLYDLDPIQRCYLNDDLGLDAGTARSMSPQYLLESAGSSGKLIFAVGADETEEFLRQQAAFADAWDRKVTVRESFPNCQATRAPRSVQ